MHYFISTREDYNTSAIELAQVKRMKIFDALGISSQIIELEKNDFIEETRKKLNVNGRVINLFQYFQNLPQRRITPTAELLDQILNHAGLKRKDAYAYDGAKVVIKAHLFQDRLYYVDYLDQYGFTVKREFYSYNCLNYIEFFDDHSQLKMREFVNDQKLPVIREYFCRSNQGQAMLTMIELNRSGQTLRFNNLSQLEGYFLDQIVDESSVFYCDRCTQVLPTFKEMKKNNPKYVVFHSALTPSGYMDDQIYSVYQPVKQLYQEGILNGIISSTKREAEDAAKAFNIPASYAIPVTYVPDVKQVKFESRKNDQIIAVARVDAIKQLGHLIDAVIALKERFPQLLLSIYGNTTDQAESQKLQDKIAKQNAGSYIKFCGFAQNLDEVYNAAQLEVLTSRNEGFAMALLEAQAHGCPAISYDINYGPAEIIADGKSGRLIKANDQKELVSVMAELLSKPKLLAAYSSGAYLQSQKFSFKSLQLSWLQFLNQEGFVG